MPGLLDVSSCPQDGLVVSVQSDGGDTEAQVDLTIPIPPFTVSGLAATAILIVLARFSNGNIFILWPLAWAAATTTLAVVVFRRGSAVSQRLGSWAKPVGALVVVAALMGAGGTAYTYGFYGDLAAFATADADPLDLSDGANHTVSFELKNVGTTTVRIFPTLRLALENASGEAIGADFGCPPSMGRLSTDRNVKELPPGGTIEFKVKLQSDGMNLPSNTSCPRWHVVAGETYFLYAIVGGRAGSITLPVWVGSVESNRIAVIP